MASWVEYREVATKMGMLVLCSGGTMVLSGKDVENMVGMAVLGTRVTMFIAGVRLM